MRRFCVTVALLAVAPAAEANAQDARVSVSGVAFDSLRGEPIKDAVVVVLGMERSTTTDARGRFRLDSVTPGNHTFIIQHAWLDAVGLPGISRRATVTDGRQEVKIAVPSFETLWRAACGGKPPKDTGFVFGTIRDVAQRAPVADATVRLSWIETSIEKKSGVRQRRTIVETSANARGAYAVCGVPTSTWVRVEARAGNASGAIDLPSNGVGVQRSNLLVGAMDADSATFGTIAGILTDERGFAFSDARVLLDDSTETRSAGDGSFRFRAVMPGTRQLEVFSLGMMPIVTSIDVLPRDSARIALELRRVTTLDVVRVTAPTNRARMIAEGIEQRRKSGFGYTMDMTELAAHATFATVLRDFPGTRVVYRAGDYTVTVPNGRGGECTPEIWIDGHHMALSALIMIRPKEVTAVELYARPQIVPMEYRPHERMAYCGVLLVWTNWAFSR